MSHQFRYALSESDDATIVALGGELDMSTAEEMLDVLVEAVRQGDVVIDASEVTFIDSSGIRSLVAAYREANRGVGAGRTVTIRNPSAQVRRVLELTSLDGLIAE
jgi:anti-sigma B factor antagonist